MKANRLVLLALAGAAAFALTGCDTGNKAAEVNGTVITTGDVDFATRANCDLYDAANEGGEQGVQAAPRRAIRASMVGTLIQTELAEQYAAENGVKEFDTATLQQRMSGYEAAAQGLSEEDRERFGELLERVNRAELLVVSTVQKKLVAGGVEATPEQLQEAITADFGAFVQKADVEVNPVYGADESNQPGAIDPSLSQAVSDFAKQSSAVQPDAIFVDRLPDSQRCG